MNPYVGAADPCDPLTSQKGASPMSDHFTLPNSVTIPSPGFGTYLMPEEPATVDAIVQALRLGYRHIDTAYFYGNETCVGEAIRASGGRRSSSPAKSGTPTGAISPPWPPLKRP